MSTGNTPRSDADLEAFLARESPLSTVYDAIEPVQPPEVLDARILAMARGPASGAGSGAASSAGSTAAARAPATARPAAAAPAAVKPAAVKPAAVKPPAVGTGTPPVARPAAPSGPPPAARVTRSAPAADTDDDVDDDPPPARRPRWLLPAALAATVLVAVGVGVNLLDTGTEPVNPGADSATSSRLGAIFAKRARERQEAEQAAAAAAAASEEAEVELAPLPPPPFFEPAGPRIEDVDKAIAVIRRELVLANQAAATAAEAQAGDQALATGGLSAPAAALAGKTAAPPAGVADAAPASAPPAAPATAPDAAIVQPRDRRLAKILELYDSGNPELAVDSLEIFLRDFADDPVSQRIEESQPRATDVAVE